MTREPNTPLPFIRTDPAVPVPIKTTEGAAALDCFAAAREFYRSNKGELNLIDPKSARTFDIIKYSTGTVFEIPDGHVGLACARSSICKMPLMLANGVGVIDADFRGELAFLFRILDAENIENTAYQVGERMGQLLITKLPNFTLTETSEISETSRGSDAFGSTGR